MASYEFTVDRSKWRFGGESKIEEQGLTKLLNEKGFMCCLGFAVKSCGIPDEYLHIDYPSDLVSSMAVKKKSTLLSKLVNYIEGGNYILDTFLTSSAINCNDTPNLSNEERESELVKLFAENDIKVTFVGEYPSISNET